MIEVGTVCIKTAGREAGRYCVVVEKVDDNFVVVTGPKALTGVRRRKSNIAHLEPTKIKVKIEAKADDAAVESAFTDDILKKLGIEKKAPAKKKEKEAKEGDKGAKPKKPEKEKKK